MAHTAELAAATPLPVNADLEDCFADDPAGVAATITAAARRAAGASIEDFSATRRRPIHEHRPGPERVARGRSGPGDRCGADRAGGT